MNMNIENFKEEHFALYQIWHRGATTYIPNAQILSLLNFHLMECFTKNHPVLEIHIWSPLRKIQYLGQYLSAPNMVR